MHLPGLMWQSGRIIRDLGEPSRPQNSSKTLRVLMTKASRKVVRPERIRNVLSLTRARVLPACREKLPGSGDRICDLLQRHALELVGSTQLSVIELRLLTIRKQGVHSGSFEQVLMGSLRGVILEAGQRAAHQLARWTRKRWL